MVRATPRRRRARTIVVRCRVPRARGLKCAVVAKKSRRHFTAKPDSNRKAKLAARAVEREALRGDPRPFKGLVGECDIVAMQQFVPSATVEIVVDGVDHTVALATVLPGAIAAMTRAVEDGTQSLVGLQTKIPGPDAGRDLAAALDWLRTAEPGETLPTAQPTADTPALGELLAGTTSFAVEVHKNFDWWMAKGTPVHPQVQQAIKNANAAMMPTERIDTPGADAAWWVDAGERAHIRWVRPEDETLLFDALARLHNRGQLNLGEGSSFAGTFRTAGLLVPVFDLDNSRPAEHWVDGLAAADAALAEVLADTSELSSEERSSRNGLLARQITLR